LRKSGDFQAEYEGSIPFTRSITRHVQPVSGPETSVTGRT
jgi:hypothetical protein